MRGDELWVGMEVPLDNPWPALTGGNRQRTPENGFLACRGTFRMVQVNRDEDDARVGSSLDPGTRQPSGSRCWREVGSADDVAYPDAASESDAKLVEVPSLGVRKAAAPVSVHPSFFRIVLKVDNGSSSKVVLLAHDCFRPSVYFQGGQELRLS